MSRAAHADRQVPINHQILAGLHAGHAALSHNITTSSRGSAARAQSDTGFEEISQS